MSPETIRVAVTGMGSPLGQNIYKALRMSRLPLEIDLLDIYPFSVGLLWEGRPVVCAPVREPAYIDELARFLARENIRTVFFGTEVEPRAIAPHVDRLERETPTRFMLNSVAALRIADDKLLTAEHLRLSGLDSPASADATDHEAVEAVIERVGFPLVAKPRRGSAARDVTIANDRESLWAVLRPGHVVQECLTPDDEEYTVGIYRCRNGLIAAVTIIQRHLEFGLTYKGKVLASHPQIEDYAVRVVEAMGIYASCNVQLRLTARGPVAFEVNPRFSSTTPIRAYFGVNEPELAIREYVLGQTLERLRARPGGVLRHWSETYLEADELERVLARDRSFWERGE